MSSVRNVDDDGELICVSETAPWLMVLKVPTPYVNHISTLTGGVGFDDLSRFYKVTLDLED